MLVGGVEADEPLAVEPDPPLARRRRGLPTSNVGDWIGEIAGVEFRDECLVVVKGRINWCRIESDDEDEGDEAMLELKLPGSANGWAGDVAIEFEVDVGVSVE